MARWWCGKHYIMFYFASLFLQIYATAIVHLFYTVRKIDVITGRRNFMKFSECTRKNKIACIHWLNIQKAEIIKSTTFQQLCLDFENWILCTICKPYHGYFSKNKLPYVEAIISRSKCRQKQTCLCSPKACLKIHVESENNHIHWYDWNELCRNDDHREIINVKWK